MSFFPHNINSEVQEDMSEVWNESEVCFHYEVHKII